MSGPALIGTAAALLLAPATVVLLGAASVGASSATLDQCGPGGSDTNVTAVDNGAPISVKLSAEQLASAQAITTEVLAEHLPQQAATVSIATALQESSLINLDHGHADSIGLYQQRPSQGYNAAESMNPRLATKAFLARLVKIPGWQTLPVADAAARVQLPNAKYRGEYAKYAAVAAQITARYWPKTTTPQTVPAASARPTTTGTSATLAPLATPTRPTPSPAATPALRTPGTSASPAVTDGDGIPSDTTTSGDALAEVTPCPGLGGDMTGYGPSVGAGPVSAVTMPSGLILSGTDADKKAAAFALAQLGEPYVYGATGPGSWDCSSLMQAAWASAGVAIPRTTHFQVSAGSPVPAAQVRTGDLVLIPGSDGSMAHPGHVGMVLGAQNGQLLIIQAPHTGDVVKISPYSSWARQIAAIRRIG